MYLSDFLIWGTLLAVVIYFCEWSRRVRNRARNNFKLLAEKYQLKVAPAVTYHGPCAEGRLDSRIFRFSEFSEKRNGQSLDLLWFELEVSEASGFTFHLLERNVGLELVRELGEADVTLGDPEFDQRWHADTNDTEKFRRIFSPEIRLLVDAATAASRWGELRLLDGWLSYREQSDLDGPAIQARFDGLRKMLAGLARAAEAASGPHS